MQRAISNITSFAAVLLILCALPALAAPPAPTLLSPADQANVTTPFTISWSAVNDGSGIVAYNWQVSASSKFSSIALQDSTSGATTDTVSGLAKGTYFWRVQAVNGSFQQGAWSNARRFNITGASSSALASPVLGPPQAYSTFHPLETMTLNWSAVPGAASYVLQASTSSSFPVSTRFQFDNIPNTTYTFSTPNEGSYFARVLAVDANGVASAPSNVITFSVFYNNPIGPPPQLVSPDSGTSVTLPVTLTWAHVPNPQPSGYELQIARDSGFTSIEDDSPQLNGPSRQVLSLSPGTKFWRVRSAQGDASPSTSAVTAWSTPRSFTVSSASVPASVSLAMNPLFGGQTTLVQIQLTSAVSSAGATIALSSSNPAALPMPASINMPPNTAWVQFDLRQFGLKAGQVTAPTPVTITASLNGANASGQFTVLPPSVNTLTIFPTTISGGAQAGATLTLNGEAPPSGATISLSSDSAVITPPATVSIPAGGSSASFAIDTNSVAAPTTGTVTASWNNSSTQAQLTVKPPVAPASIVLSPTSTVGLGGGSFATVTVASATNGDTSFSVSSSNPAIASVPTSMIVPSGSTTGGFNIFTSDVTTQTAVTISVSGGGVTKSAILTVTPQSSSTTTPPPSSTSATLTVSASGRSGESVLSNPSGINVRVGGSGSASFNAGTSITLSATNGRDAIWSGACSSNGNKTKSCTFTLSSSASVSANVQ